MSNVSTLARPSKTTRSRIANGSTLHAGEVDGRSVEARRFRDVFSEILSDLGGSDSLSEGQRQLARRAAMLCLRAELMEADAVKDGTIDLASLWRPDGSARPLLQPPRTEARRPCRSRTFSPTTSPVPTTRGPREEARHHAARPDLARLLRRGRHDGCRQLGRVAGHPAGHHG